MSPILFEHDVPPGFRYLHDFISEAEEQALIEGMATVAFSDSPADATSARRSATHEVLLDRRSAYLMTEASRTAYEHHIPTVKATLR